MRKQLTVAALAAGCLALPGGVALAATPSTDTTVVKGLDDPWHVQFTGRNTALVAENFSGEVSRVNIKTGAVRTLISDLTGVASVTEWDRHIYAVLGGGAPPESGAPAPPPSKYAPTSVIRANLDGSGVKVIANLEKYELKNNPDGQVQFVKGQPVDALSNPFDILATRQGLLVTDGGANDVLKVNPKTGKVSTFFVPPTITTGACAGAENNPGTVGCDAVPTGITVENGSVYVSALGSHVPGAGRVYELSRDGEVQRVYGSLTEPTGVDVTTDSTLYISHVTYGAPAGEGPPPPGFDPATVGRITKIAPNGARTYAQVTMPIDLELHRGDLYATSWSVAGAFFGAKGRGEIVRVNPLTFK